MKTLMKVCSVALFSLLFYSLPSSADSLFPEDGTDGIDIYYPKPRDFKVGDIILVKVDESALATSAARTDVTGEHKTDVSFINTGILDAVLAPVWRLIGLGGSLSEKTKNDYKGEGDTDRKGRLSALVSVLVVDVLEDGNLVIEGRKEVKVNRETQILIVSGIVRRLDVDEDNTVLSYKIADTRIEYIGEGQLSEKLKPGFISRIFDILF